MRAAGVIVLCFTAEGESAGTRLAGWEFSHDPLACGRLLAAGA